MKYVVDHGFACPDMLLVLSIQVYNKQFDMFGHCVVGYTDICC